MKSSNSRPIPELASGQFALLAEDVIIWLEWHALVSYIHTCIISHITPYISAERSEARRKRTYMSPTNTMGGREEYFAPPPLLFNNPRHLWS